MESFVKYLSLAPVLAIVWLALQASLLAVFVYIFPDLLFHPLP